MARNCASGLGGRSTGAGTSPSTGSEVEACRRRGREEFIDTNDVLLRCRTGKASRISGEGELGDLGGGRGNGSGVGAGVGAGWELVWRVGGIPPSSGVAWSMVGTKSSSWCSPASVKWSSV